MPVTFTLRFSRDLEDPAAKPGTELTEPIHVLAWSWGMSSSERGDGSPAFCRVQDLSMTKFTDQASAVIAGACCAGRRLRTAVLVAQLSSKAPVAYSTITMKDVLISSLSTGGSGGEDRLTENFTLSFTCVAVEIQQKPAKGKKPAKPTGYSWTQPKESL